MLPAHPADHDAVTNDYPKEQNMSTLEVTAPDISCEHCKRSIEHDLGAAPGVHRVVVDVGTQRVRLDYDDAETSPEALRSTLAGIGYPPA